MATEERNPIPATECDYGPGPGTMTEEIYIREVEQRRGGIDTPTLNKNMTAQLYIILHQQYNNHFCLTRLE